MTSLHEVEEALRDARDLLTPPEGEDAAQAKASVLVALAAVRAYPDTLREARGLLERVWNRTSSSDDWDTADGGGVEGATDAFEAEVDAFLERMR